MPDPHHHGDPAVRDDGLVSLVVAPGADGRPALAAVRGDGLAHAGPVGEIVAVVRALEAERRPRWVWWAAGRDAVPVVAAGLSLARCWDLAEVHRLLHGGWAAEPGLVWAAAHGIPVGSVPAPPSQDLFAFADEAPPPTTSWSAPTAISAPTQWPGRG